MDAQKPKVVTVVGPTSSGKTSLSIAIAKEFNGEVVSADSRQVYRGMDLGTGKVTPEEMDGVPHHLLDVADPMGVYTGADFAKDAAAAINDIVNRRRLPIIAGGTFFYIELLNGTMEAPPVEPNPELRAQLEEKSDLELMTELLKKDPRRAATIDPENRRRLIRALEIIEALGSVPEPSSKEPNYDMLTIGIDIPQEQLHSNIRIRLDERIKDGMIAEVARLHEQGVTWERMEDLGLEYRYVSRFLRGLCDEQTMRNELEIKIRQFAKRQLTWLKRDESIEWYTPEDRFAVFRRVNEFLK